MYRVLRSRSAFIMLCVLVYLSVLMSLWSPPALSLLVDTRGSDPWESMLIFWPICKLGCWLCVNVLLHFSIGIHWTKLCNFLRMLTKAYLSNDSGVKTWLTWEGFEECCSLKLQDSSRFTCIRTLQEGFFPCYRPCWAWSCPSLRRHFFALQSQLTNCVPCLKDVTLLV